MERAFQRYLRHHRAIGSSEKTRQYHTDTIQRSLFPFLRSQGHSLKLDDFCLDDVLDWLDAQRDKGLAQKTIRTRVVSVKAWTRWLVEEEWLPTDPLRKLKVPKVDDTPKATLSPDDIDTLLRACNAQRVTGLRDRAIVLLAFSTGLRLQEMLSLRVEDIDWDKGLILVRRGKGGKFRTVPLGGKAERALAKYLDSPKRPDSTHVFLNTEGEGLSYKGFRNVFYRLEERTGIRCNPHKWRHSCAVQYLRNGGRLEALKEILGHSTLDMTLVYGRLAGVDLANAHETADPARSLKTRV